MTTLHEAQKAILEFRDRRDWAQFHTPRNLAAALSIEAGELQEAILWKTDEEAASFNETAAGRLHIQRELADILIYALLLCHETGIEPLQAIKSKLAENEAKYPAHLSRGRSDKYSQL